MTNRDPTSGKFLPGNKANPGGRPKSELSITALIDQAVTADDWKFIFSTLLRNARRGNLKAIDMLLDRRFGKATQPLAGENGGAIPISIIEIIKDTTDAG